MVKSCCCLLGSMVRSFWARGEKVGAGCKAGDNGVGAELDDDVDGVGAELDDDDDGSGGDKAGDSGKGCGTLGAVGAPRVACKR